jgi:hypothetical protein
LNALVKNWRQKARNSATIFARPARLAAGAGAGRDVLVAMTQALLFVMRGLPAQNAVFDAENEISPDLLKDRFNCYDLARVWFRPRNHRGERMENARCAVAL